MSSFAQPSGGSERADARRNRDRILDAAAELLALDPAVGLASVATRAGLSRTTLYHHFPSREALLDGLTERSVAEVAAALAAAQPERGGAEEAMARMLSAAWQVVGHYRGLVMVNPRRLERAELRRRLGPALAPLRSLLERGRRSGEFDPGLPIDWSIGIVTDLVHAASGQVSAGTMSAAEGERVLLRTVAAALTGHRRAG